MSKKTSVAWMGVALALGALSVGCSSLGSPELDRGGPGEGEEEGGERTGVAVIDVPSSGCTILAALCTEVYGRGAIAPLTDLSRTPHGWLARGAEESGFVLFDADGANATEAFVTTGLLDRVAAFDDAIYVATVDAEGVRARRYRWTGGPLGEDLRVSSDRASALAMGHTSSTAAILWSTPARIALRLWAEEGGLGEEIEIERDIPKDDVHMSIASSETRPLAFAYTERTLDDSRYRTVFAQASAEGLSGAPRVLFSGPEPRRVVALRESPGGYVLLVEKEGQPIVLRLSPSGTPLGPAHRFLGLARAHDLAVGDNGEMMLAALRDDGKDAVILLDEAGAPESGWHCLHAYASDGPHHVSLAPTEGGYVALYRSIVAQELFYRIEPAAMTMPRGD